MLAVCRHHGLPVPAVNSEPVGFEVDFAWWEQRLVVETDGWAAHRSPGAFESDRVRDAVIVEAGWRVIRITRRRLAGDPGAVGALIARLLAAPGV